MGVLQPSGPHRAFYGTPLLLPLPLPLLWHADCKDLPRYENLLHPMKSLWKIAIKYSRVSNYHPIFLLNIANLFSVSSNSIFMYWLVNLLHFTASGVIPALNYVDLTVITNTQCASTYGSIITATKNCCSTSGGQSTCNVSFSFRYSSEIHFLLSTTQNLLPPPRPHKQ
jgi:hypothetical protein